MPWKRRPPDSKVHSFDNDILHLFNANLVSMEEALMHADDPEHLQVKVRLGGGISSAPEDIYSI